MKGWKRTLAALLAAIMLMVPWSTTAELALEPDALPEAEEGLELEIAPEAVGDVPDLELELPDTSELDGLDIEEVDLDAVTIEDVVIDGAEAEAGDPILSNDDNYDDDDDSDSEFEIDDGVLVKYNGYGGDVAIPDGVTRIGEKAFVPTWYWNNDKVTSVTIPDSVTSIGKSAFCGSIGLTSVTIGKGLNIIEEQAFSGCYNLTSITIPNSVTSIGDSAFEDCSSLTNVTISNSITSIGDSVFKACSSLTSVTIPNSVTSIGDDAFYDCSNLTSVTIPNSVTSIGWHAFSYCSSLASITIPGSVKSIDLEAFQYCSSLTSVTIDKGVKSIGWYAFSNCSSLTSVSIPDSVTSIGDSVFEYCSSLTSVTIPDSVTSIDRYAFYGCSSLTSITIPNSVKSIGYCAFEYCSNLTSVTIYAADIDFGPYDFYNTHDDLKFYIVCNSNAADNFSSSQTTLIHNKVVDPAISPTYTEPGKTEGTICTVCGKVFSGQETIPPIELTKTSLSLEVTQSETLEIISQGDRAVTWSSSNISIASVTNGTVTAIREGECTISATFSDGHSLTCKITVTDPAVLSKTELSLNAGATYELKVSKLGNRTVAWSSSDATVATVKAGTVTAIGEGSCTITATLSNSKALECAITVKDPAKLSKTELSMNVGATYALKVSNLGNRTVTWSSSDEKVATVKDGTVTAIGEGSCTITATLSNGKALKCSFTVKDSAKLSKTELSMNIGEKYALKVSNLGNRTVTWSSSDEKVATVKGGTVTAIKAGKCTITAKVKNGKTLKCKVTVRDAARLSKTKLSLNVGRTYKLKVNEAGKRTVTWSSSNKKVAMVKDGIITAIKAGRCIITATLSNGKKLKCSVTVEEPAYISKTKLSINAGRTATLKVYYLGNRKVTWSSSDKKVATVKNGTVTAIKAGACTIIATLSNGETFKCKVTVKDAARFTETKLSLKPGESQTLRISGLYGREVAWSSSDEKIATVKDGKVTAVYIGSCTITAQIKNGKKLTCKVTVTDAAALSNDKLTISNIDTDRIALTGGLNRKVTWSTSNKNVVEITMSDNNAASIKAVKNGTATITAKVEGGKTLKCVVKVVDPLTIELDEIDEESIYNKVWVYFNNHSNKKITYVTLDIAQYNNRGDKLESPYSYFYLNESVAPHDSLHHYYWVNDDTKKVRFTITEVTFADKTTWRP